jgi:hypothetical protein
MVKVKGRISLQNGTLKGTKSLRLMFQHNLSSFYNWGVQKKIGTFLLII